MRKRTNLDKLEANYIFSKILLAVNKSEKFLELSLPERNRELDKLSKLAIEKANRKEEDRKALQFEATAYKLTEDETAKAYSEENYIPDLPRPQNFNEMLSEKYDSIIKELVKGYESLL